MFVGGEYAQYLAQRQKTFKSYYITIVFDIDDPDIAWDNIYNRIRDLVVEYEFWYIPTLECNDTVRSEYVQVEHYEFTLVNRRRNQPRCMLSLYRFKQDYTIGKEPYRNLFIILRHFKTPLSQIACEILNDETSDV